MTGGDTEHTIAKEGVKLQREIMAQDKDLQVIHLQVEFEVTEATRKSMK